MTFNSRTGVFSQAFNSAALSANDVWKRNSISGWTSDSSSSDYGIWSGNVTVNSYLVSSTPNGNYGDVYLGNFQAAANLPAANPTANAFRIYLATDSGTAPVKPYLEQRPTHVGGPNPPLVGQTTTVAVSIAITNPTTQPITFSAANLVTANIPGGGAVYAGSPQVTQGALVSQPTIGGTGNITWNPGTLAAGALASLSYYVDATHRTITDNGGRYLFENVAVDGFYTITPTRANYQFNPSSRAFSLLGDMTEAVFTGTQTGDNQNPLDNEDFFVRQQYLDFLGREPEHGGWLYWTDEITRCAGDEACRYGRTIDVSAAFFRSDEFQQSGSFVYRLYTAGLGRQLSFAEFTTDRSQVLGGPNLEQSKDNFTRSFVRRPEFVERYGNADTSENFVDAIIHGLQTWSNIDLSSQRGALLDAYNSGLNQDDSRRLVLRLVIQDVGFLQAEYNRSFVLMQYFGYLQRDPDVGGYEFWLDVINNREPNNYRGMVLRVRHVGRIPAPLQLAGDSK